MRRTTTSGLRTRTTTLLGEGGRRSALAATSRFRRSSHGGWSDLFALGSVRGFVGLRAHGGSPAARSGTMFVMQPGGHGGAGRDRLRSRERHRLRGPSAAVLRSIREGRRQSGARRESRRQLFVQVPPDTGTKGHGFWVTADTFPLPGTQKIEFNLRSGGRANSAAGRRRARSR